ncbi:hypothetical protein EMIHUDRAFT_249708 [Emiliania huxleyi CCMP1516]|uniref:Uncharacterized protein n=2 Tax=Emiliania huxleyi TaxID=2903 RepID=A0A0D3I618_EMIH1|nr:hypothetical protein EMIHUDRAFT_249708 [Emiliania huxleyi CCMP1516]EOD06703.1 hypothetical protein EMIHUDRAFT_249708 [Emiliania huxleyi CCMP1516]|eukprot:XP_005759132.1 hypothetical protein EMIHUDRAFT_249708 [Emiliania huxleyi CCMP1516]
MGCGSSKGAPTVTDDDGTLGLAGDDERAAQRSRAVSAARLAASQSTLKQAGPRKLSFLTVDPDRAHDKRIGDDLGIDSRVANAKRRLRRLRDCIDDVSALYASYSKDSAADKKGRLTLVLPELSEWVSEGAWIGAPAVGSAVGSDATRLVAIAQLVRAARAGMGEKAVAELHAARRRVAEGGIEVLLALENLVLSASVEREAAARAVRKATAARAACEEELEKARGASEARREAAVEKATAALYAAESDIFRAEDLRRKADEELQRLHGEATAEALRAAETARVEAEAKVCAGAEAVRAAYGGLAEGVARALAAQGASPAPAPRREEPSGEEPLGEATRLGELASACEEERAAEELRALRLSDEERVAATAACDRAIGGLQRELGKLAARLSANCDMVSQHQKLFKKLAATEAKVKAAAKQADGGEPLEARRRRDEAPPRRVAASVVGSKGDARREAALAALRERADAERAQLDASAGFIDRRAEELKAEADAGAARAVREPLAVCVREYALLFTTRCASAEGVASCNAVLAASGEAVAEAASDTTASSPRDPSPPRDETGAQRVESAPGTPGNPFDDEAELEATASEGSED